MNDLSIALLTLASIAGTLLAALLGWLDSGEAFVGRKFTASILRAIVAGIVTAVGFIFGSTAETAGALDYILAVLAGAGIDVLGNRLAGAIKA